jgi:hypothetical protein
MLRSTARRIVPSALPARSATGETGLAKYIRLAQFIIGLATGWNRMREKVHD